MIRSIQKKLFNFFTGGAIAQRLKRSERTNPAHFYGHGSKTFKRNKRKGL